MPATKSWESWWAEEQEHLQYTRFMGQFREIVLSISVWSCVLFKIVFMGRKKFSADYQRMFRLLKLFLFIGFIVTLVILFLFLNLTVGDIFVNLLAFMPIGWAPLSVCSLYLSGEFGSSKAKNQSTQEKRTARGKIAAAIKANPKDKPIPNLALNAEVSVDGKATKAAHSFTFDQVIAATGNFRLDYFLGEGGFGKVYKGFLEETNQVVAIKQLDQDSLQGTREFVAEVSTLSTAEHPNLVKLIGFCAEDEQRLLVYEYMPLGSLEDHLHDLEPNQKPLDWNTRMEIAAGAARGLEYLHVKMKPPVIYRDLKCSNILLGEGYHPKLSDFGLARVGPSGDKTHVSTRVMGTKAVHYSKERRAEYLVGWARPRFKDRRNFSQMADPLLQGQYPMKGLYQALAVAAMCVQEQPNMRPAISDVVNALNYLTSHKYDPNNCVQSSRRSKTSSQAKNQSTQEKRTARGKIAAAIKANPKDKPIPNLALNAEVSVDGKATKAAHSFTFDQVIAATGNFRLDYFLGEGGFGKVYKGFLEETNQVVAIKQLDQDSLQGTREFVAEVSTLSTAEHPNLVKLIGFCAEDEQRLLVYEYMPLGSLEDHLHDLEPNQKPLDWNTRMEIAAGAARGLEYLHVKMKPPVIYRDLKCSNILLGEGYHPKLSDFGLARVGPSGDKTHVSTRVMGTKAVHYSKERRAEYLVGWARPRFKDRRNFSQMADPLLQGQYPMKGLYQALAVAAMCVQEQPNMRPAISDVVNALNYLTSHKYDPNNCVQSSRRSKTSSQVNRNQATEAVADRDFKSF
ncbi:hypothetical protein V6N12_009194 [Hibiscus sabdariffa]|uniref:Protein kinase domain-containing protein n=1 Tax=Hibiscus sabdariffa TaxID=183260 RepID=A0ABR2C4Y6_9ROSI